MPHNINIGLLACSIAADCGVCLERTLPKVAGGLGKILVV